MPPPSMHRSHRWCRHGQRRGADVARKSEVVLIGNDLAKFVETVQAARNYRRIILQNFPGMGRLPSVAKAESSASPPREEDPVSG